MAIARTNVFVLAALALVLVVLPAAAESDDVNKMWKYAEEHPPPVHKKEFEAMVHNATARAEIDKMMRDLKKTADEHGAAAALKKYQVHDRTHIHTWWLWFPYFPFIMCELWPSGWWIEESWRLPFCGNPNPPKHKKHHKKHHKHHTTTTTSAPTTTTTTTTAAPNGGGNGAPIGQGGGPTGESKH